MTAASAEAAFIASRRRLFNALFASVGASPVAGPRAMRRPGRSGMRAEAAPMAPDSMTLPPDAIRWLTKGTFAFTLPELAAFNALGSDDDARWQAWVDQQLAPATIDDSACDSRVAGAGYITLGKSANQLWLDHHADTSNYYNRMLPIAESECMNLVRQVYSERQLYEVMVDFWHDHFSVYGWDYDGGPMFVAMDRDAIRPFNYALGNFRQMLQAVADSASMMYMLDLYASTRAGPNENYARELCELHTLGAENYAGVMNPGDPSLPIGTEPAPGGGTRTVRLKYVDADVYNATRILTGMTISGANWPYDPINGVPLGDYVYDDSEHDQYDKNFLNVYFPNYQHEADGTELFDILAAHPGTAHFVAAKLCRRFVGDNPSSALVQAAADVFNQAWEADDQIPQVLRTILLSDECKSTWGQKMKRPAAALTGMLRTLGADFTFKPDNTSVWTSTEEIIYRLQQAGQRLFYWPAPNGYPDNITTWSSTGTMGMTMKLLPRLLEMHQDATNAQSPFIADVQGKTLAAFPDADDRTATNIVTYWCQRTLGYMPGQTSTVAIDFLRQNAGADDPLDITTDHYTDGQPDHTGVWNANDLSQHYTIARLRTTIALLLCSPEFLRR